MMYHDVRHYTIGVSHIKIYVENLHLEAHTQISDTYLQNIYIYPVVGYR
jgi:hypothetical protein